MTLHYNSTVFISFQVRDLSAHYYNNIQTRGTALGNLLLFEKGCLRGGTAFRFVNCYRLNLLYGKNGQSKHWYTWPGRSTQQEWCCRSATFNQCSSLLACKKLQKHLDCTLKSLSHHRGSHTEASASFSIPALCVTSKVTNKCYSLTWMRLTFTSCSSCFFV